MNYDLRESQVYCENDSENQDKYFNIEIKNKKYPSCYQYNILIMLAKRLINEENEKENSKPCTTRLIP